MADKTFADVFGFQYKGGERIEVEKAIVLTKLMELAIPYKTASDKIQAIRSKYGGAEKAVNLEEAKSDLDTLDVLISEQEEAYAVWHEAQDLSTKTSFQYVNDITKFYS